MEKTSTAPSYKMLEAKKTNTFIQKLIFNYFLINFLIRENTTKTHILPKAGKINFTKNF